MNLDHNGAEELARKILLHSRRRISHIEPILLEAIYAMPEKVSPLPGPISTDGCTLWFDPEQVVEDFRRDRDSVARQLLHVTTHCLLGHLEMRDGFEQTRAFDCAADLKAAQFAEMMCGMDFAVRNGRGSAFSSYESSPHLRPLYQNLMENTSHRKHLKAKGDAARFDDHDLWNRSMPVAASAQSPNGDGEGDGNGAQGSGQSGAGQGEGDENTNQNGQGGSGSKSDGPDWARIRQSMLDGHGGKLHGSCAGMLTENFTVEQRGMSFEEFLRRFASPEERMLLDPDTFDVRWYHLGMEYYGNIPLLEPSELSEPPLPDDIVVALDVSGSCHGETCKRFLKELLGILRDIAAGAPRFRILLLLCDTEIKKEVLLETPEQVDSLFANFTVTGFGGTDFRPVFDRVARLRESGDLPRVRGLLYLSDGCGDYPEEPADYPTAFLIPAEDRRYQSHSINWITRLYLNENDFTLEEASV